jgi:HEAT repeat protein
MLARTALRTPLALALFLLISWLGAGPALAQDKKEDEEITVRFSYEAWSRGGQTQYVLVPRLVKLKQGLESKDRIREVFARLLRDKKNTYGNTRIAFKDADVYVYLDMNKAAYHPIVMAETVYSFTENGARKVLFPKKVAQGWTRDDVPYPAYVLAVPLWQGLPPNGITGALVRLPDGSLLAAAEARSRLEKKDEALLGAMWGYVDSGPKPATLAAIRAGITVKADDLQPRLLPQLRSADKDIRSAAIDGLEGRDNAEVNAALREVMDEDPEAALKDRAAALLSKSKDPKFQTAALYHALRSEDPKVASEAATGLGTSKIAEATDQLVAVLGHKAPEVRAAAIASLMQRGDHGKLAARLDDSKLDAGVRIEIATALTEGTDKPGVQSGLMHLAVNGSGEQAVAATTRLADFPSAATFAALGKALKHGEAPVRKAAAGTVGKLGQLDGLEPLAAADADDAESGLDIHTAIRTIFAGQKLDTVLEYTRNKTPILRRGAVATLGAIVKRDGSKAGKKVIPTLRTLAKDKDPLIRAAAATSFGAIGGGEVKGDLLALGGDTAVEVQRAVAAALVAYRGDESKQILTGYLTNEDGAVFAHALDTLAAHDVDSEEMKTAIGRGLNHDDAIVRRSATSALSAIAGSVPKRRLLSFFSERVFDKDVETRLRAVAGLSALEDERAVTAMAALLRDPVVEVRRQTLLAIGKSGSKSAVEVLSAGLEDDEPTVRRAALMAFAKLKAKSAAPILKQYAEKEPDKSLADEARKVIRGL